MVSHIETGRTNCKISSQHEYRHKFICIFALCRNEVDLRAHNTLIGILYEAQPGPFCHLGSIPVGNIHYINKIVMEDKQAEIIYRKVYDNDKRSLASRWTVKRIGTWNHSSMHLGL